MSSAYVEYDMAGWRRGLERQRALGASFDEAWAFVVGPAVRGTENGSGETVKAFIKKHWRAAYDRTPAPLGRSGIDEPSAGGTGTRVPVSERAHHGLCRSGVEGGCRKRAVVGRFGPTFCKGHHAELAAIAAKVPGAPPFPAGQSGSYARRAA